MQKNLRNFSEQNTGDSFKRQARYIDKNLVNELGEISKMAESGSQCLGSHRLTTDVLYLKHVSLCLRFSACTCQAALQLTV